MDMAMKVFLKRHYFQMRRIAIAAVRENTALEINTWGDLAGRINYMGLTKATVMLLKDLLFYMLIPACPITRSILIIAVIARVVQ